MHGVRCGRIWWCGRRNHVAGLYRLCRGRLWSEPRRSGVLLVFAWLVLVRRGRYHISRLWYVRSRRLQRELVYCPLLQLRLGRVRR